MTSNGATWLIFLLLWPPREMAVAVHATLFWREEWCAPIFMGASWLSWRCENIEMCASPCSWCRWFWQWQLLLFTRWFRDCGRIRDVVAGTTWQLPLQTGQFRCSPCIIKFVQHSTWYTCLQTSRKTASPPQRGSRHIGHTSAEPSKSVSIVA